MNERELFDALLEKHPTWMENIKLKGRIDERSRMLAPYDVESIEELIKNVKTKTINDAEKLLGKTAPDKVAEIKCDDGEIRNRPLIDFAKVYEILEQMIGDKNERTYVENQMEISD